MKPGIQKDSSEKNCKEKNTAYRVGTRGVLFMAGLVLATVFLAFAGNKDGRMGSDDIISVEAATTTPTPTSKPTVTVTPTPTPMPTPKPLYLVASYSGGAVVVGKEYDKKLLDVTLYYDDGTTEKLDTYDVSGIKVTAEGENKFVIIYRGMVANFYVYGKKVIGVSANLSRYNYSLGNGPDEKDLTVFLSYSDGSSDVTDEYIVSPSTVQKIGNQELTVASHGYTTKISVWGEEVKAVQSVSVSWDASYKPITGEIITKKDVSVIAVYKDYSTERVTSFELVTQRFSNPGENELKVAYRGVVATTKIEVEAKVVTDIRAEYKGPGVYVGEAPDPANIEVYVTFNDGREVEVDDYTMKPEMIEYPGENKIRITYDKVGTDIYVTGVAEPEPDFDHASAVELESDYGNFSVAVAVPKRLGDDEMLDVTTMKPSKVRKLMKKLKITGDYIPFDLQFIDDDNEAELPLPLRITIPSEFNIKYTYLYYSSNIRTQACRLGIEIDEKNNCLEPELFSKVGTYILVCDPTIEMTEDEREEFLQEESK
ncbi:MAG: bacterial Ig-like domain-containing protein [Lachnospiraceae bacterium]|nr:bacterial Ig-like domain-containing protein [Lachnospiraceae bacterium]